MTGLFIVAFAFVGFIGYCLGNSRRGRLVKYTNELPNGLMRVISTDKF